MNDSRSEINRFKTDINLVEYASDRGYQVDRGESSRNSVVMRNPSTDDKIVVSKGQNGHWKYFSVRDTSDNGSVVDFVQNRGSKNLGETRKELRPWIGENPKRVQLEGFNTTVEPSIGDRAAIASRVAVMKPITNTHYLNERGISQTTINDPRFQGMILQDERRNVIFPHRDREGVSGYEIKNRNFTGFAPSGIKSVWHSRVRKTDNKLVFTESAIDGLSYHQIKGDDKTRYMSVAGQVSPHQRDIIKAAIDKMPPGSTIVSAFDRDQQGDKFHKELQQLAPDKNIIRDSPQMGKDWNDQLKLMLKKSKFVGKGRVLELSR